MKKLVRSVKNRGPVPLNVSDFSAPFYLSPNQKAELFISDIEQVSAVKTIKDAVIELGGKLPCATMQHRYAVVEGMLLDRRKSPVDCYVCKVDEFESTAKRMGYINGYKFMEECTEKGKPNLPDDVMVSVMTHGRGRLPAGHVGFWNWNSSEIKSFRIVDERYKPVSEILESKPDAAVVSEKQESNWFDLGEFPPISEQCEWKGLNGGFWVQCEVIDKYQDKEMVVFNTGEYRNCRYEILKLDSVEFRPIRTEREKFIEQAWDRLRGDTAHKETTELLGQLYDLGYRLTVAE